MIPSGSERSIEEIFRQRALEAERLNREESERRLVQALAAFEEHDTDASICIAAASSLERLGRRADALAILDRGIARCPASLDLYEKHIRLLELSNRTEEAAALAHRATLSFPDNVRLRMREALLLPILYDTPEQVDHYRQRFADGLRRLSEDVRLDTLEARQSASRAIRHDAHLFYLGYQGRNDREMQDRYGSLVHRIMAANYPQWVRPLPMPEVPEDGQLRVGYVSASFMRSSVSKAFLGWLREHDRGKVEVYAYHVGRERETDSVTEQVRRISRFRHFGRDLEATPEAILNDRLHVLVFLDVGMSSWMTMLGALRLAPIQCVTWGHPLSSGLETIDYFISSELMEPQDAQDHYSEELVRLPGIGVCYPKPMIPAVLVSKNRRDFGLREHAVVYLSCQSVFKYLPDQDRLFAQIAARVPDSQFVFLVANEIVRGDLARRLERAFAAAGLCPAKHCVLLPWQSRLDYWSLELNSDVFLDTIGFSGCISTFEAIAAGLPLVTLPGSQMRGRQSAAILTQLGVTETIARKEADYVQIAVRLGLDREWRQDVIDQMVAGYPRLYSDTRGIRALEDFYRRVVEDRLLSQAGEPTIERSGWNR